MRVSGWESFRRTCEGLKPAEEPDDGDGRQGFRRTCEGLKLGGVLVLELDVVFQTDL